MISCIEMNTTRETFEKSERLCSTKIISSLFETGNVFYTSHFKVVWAVAPATLSAPAQVTFSVSKKGFKLAVTRNLIKRRIREAYRKKKKTLYEHLLSENIKITFVVILRGNSIPDYPTIEKSIKEVINKLIANIKKVKKSEDGSRESEAGTI
jgi:ribonuclease P protein component